MGLCDGGGTNDGVNVFDRAFGFSAVNEIVCPFALSCITDKSHTFPINKA